MMRHLLSFVVMLILTMLFDGMAHAQQTLLIDINRGTFFWDWTKGTGGDVAEFRMKCGTLVYIIADPAARSVPVLTVVTQPGSYTCVLTAVNEFGESAPTLGVSFRAGSAPNSPTGLRITAQ